jgi:hypothetical protein
VGGVCRAWKNTKSTLRVIVETCDGKIPLEIPWLGGNIILKFIMKITLDVKVLAGAKPHVYF